MQVCRDLGIAVSKPRTANQQTMRNNAAADTEEDFYGRVIFIPFLDEFPSALDVKFLAHKNVLKLFQFLVSEAVDVTKGKSEKSILNLAEFYELPTNIAGEVSLWRQFLLSCQKKIFLC